MKRNIVVIGGGFCGAFCVKSLIGKIPKEYEVILMDKKDSFEYTPSILKVVTDQSYIHKISEKYGILFPKAKIIISDRFKVYSDAIITEDEEIKYDYLVICPGNKTPIFVSNRKDVYTLKTISNALDIQKKINNSNEIAIIGGGLTGCELAGELATKTIKNISLIEGAERLVFRLPMSASSKVHKFLTKRKVDIYLGEKVIKNENNKLHTDKGNEIRFDIAIWVSGVISDVSFLIKKDFGDAIGEKDRIMVNKYLRVKGFENVYAGGDICAIDEEKTAQMAEKHGIVIAKNILNSINNEEFRLKKAKDSAISIRMKKELVEYHSQSWVWLLSLGDYNALLGKKKFVFGYKIPSMMKKIVEFWMMMRIKYF